MKKAGVCFIGRNKMVCSLPAQQLNHFLGQYLDVTTWSLNNLNDLTGFVDSDIYITSCNAVYNIVKPHLPNSKSIFVSARTINTEKLDKLMGLEPQTQAIFATHSEETALKGIEMIRNFGINHIEMYPYFPGSKIKISAEITTAIITGSHNVVPSAIQKVIDLGAKGLDISTFAQLIQHLHLPLNILNEISSQYIQDIITITAKRQQIASLNRTLLNTVTQAIIAVDEGGKIIILNPAAEKLLRLQEEEAIGKSLGDVVPEVDLSSIMKDKKPLIHDLRQIGSNFFVIDANPIINNYGCFSGVITTIRPVAEVQELETKVRRELKPLGNIAKYTFRDIIGDSAELKKAIQLATKFAQTESTILLEGESGTGKEMFAQAIHNYSHRNQNSFVAINFAALPENLIESELYGYEEGAFTGAKKGGKSGLFEEAHKGTIFLDEIGDASLEVQKRLLRVLEEREVRRVGGRTVTPVDVRVIAATNRDLAELVKAGQFREDLYYRLCALPITIPSLSMRGNDVLKLVDFFSRKLCGYPLLLDDKLSAFLCRYPWPGNIRELQNIVTYLYNIVDQRKAASINHLPAYIMRTEHFNYTAETKSDENKNLIDELENQNSLQVVATILQELSSTYTLDNKSVGRQKLLKKLEELGLGCSEYKVRYWLKFLTKNEYLITGITKQGSKITEKGCRLLSQIRNLKSF